MKDIPPLLPDDWWPDRVLVTGTVTTKDNIKYELNFLISKEDCSGISGKVKSRLEALRMALWQGPYVDPNN